MFCHSWFFPFEASLRYALGGIPNAVETIGNNVTAGHFWLQQPWKPTKQTVWHDWQILFFSRMCPSNPKQYTSNKKSCIQCEATPIFRYHGVTLLMAASYGRLLGTLFLKDLAPRGTLLGPRSALTSNFGAGSSDWQVGNSRASAGSFLFGFAICPNMIWVVRLDSSSSRSSRRREQLTKGLAHIYEHQSGSESDRFMFSTCQC